MRRGLRFHGSVRVLFLENEDSFSWNVIESLPVGREHIRIRPGREAARDPSALEEAELVVVGPGPTDPERAGIVDVIHAAARLRLPLLGICLGHQALGLSCIKSGACLCGLSRGSCGTFTVTGTPCDTCKQAVEQSCCEPKKPDAGGPKG